MWGYILVTITFGLSYLAYLIKTKVYDYEDYLENVWCKANKWFPTSEEETLDNIYLPVSTDKTTSSDRLIFSGGDAQGNLILLGIERTSCITARVKAHLWLTDGRKLETFSETEELLPCSDWTCRDFSFQLLEPFDSWRIVVNTMMKCGETYVHVNLRFIWRTSTRSIYLQENVEQELYYSAKKSTDTLWGHDQYGFLSGSVVIDGTSSVIHYLCSKQRSWHTDWFVCVQSDHEQMFTLNFAQGSCIGHYYKFNKAYDVFKKSDFVHERSLVEISIPMPDRTIKKYSLDIQSSSQSVNMVDNEFSFNFKSLFHEVSERNTVPPLSLLNIPPPTTKLLVSLSEEEAMNAAAVGGKAANLAILKSLAKNTKTQITIPCGFCITAEAYRQHITSNPTISHVIYQLDYVHEDDLELKCKKLQTLWLSSRLSHDLISLLSSHLDPGAIYAVRSSGTEEDTSASSAAGQNESVLGVSGEEEVRESIVLCWSSLFSYQSVQYRRKNGLKVSSSQMCVLIQELVPNVHAAGVLFSCDPVTGNPWTSVISCNFGLGLSVVSATCDPDTFTITRDVAKHYEVKNKKCGIKGNKTIFEDDTIQDIALNNEDSAAFSITDEQALYLSQLGHDTRRLFGYECDLEWVLDKDNDVHVVQVRPITSIYNWTDYELIHEFDSPIHEGYDLVTFHNIGEACPGFISPISLTPMKVFDKVIQEILKSCVDTNLMLENSLIYSYHGTMALFHTSLLIEDDPVGQIILCGQVVSTPEIHKLFLRRSGLISNGTKLKMGLTVLMNAIRSESITNGAISLSENLTIPVNDNPKDIMNNILKALSTFQLVGFKHCNISGVCALVQRILIVSVLRKERKELSSDSFAQVANSIINSTNTVSVDITHQFKKIVASIICEDPELKFLTVDSVNGFEWLKENCIKSYELLDEFLIKCGHRGNKEIDLMSETWSMNKPKVIEMLRTLVQAKSKQDTNKNKDDGNQDCENLKKAKVLEESQILNLLLPLARKVVARRELTKNALVLCCHKVRLAVLHLGVTMQRAGLLPHSRLIFFLTLYEVKQILSGRNLGAVSKALRRERLAPMLDKLIFHPQALGRPILVNREPKVLSIGKPLTGTPVWPGEVIGTARVILAISEATSICQGEILITHATDTGWTPYFSMLGGLVTELGGILSHGAVVAREYGLPCIVGVDDATLCFKTGDKVLLNSSKGTIEKVLEEHEE